MKNSASIVFLLLVSIVSYSQQSKPMTLQFWDADGKRVVNEKKAKFLTTVEKINDTCWQHQNYQMMGPLISSGAFKDKAGKVRHGRSSFMRTAGTLDSTGYFINGVLNGEWLYFDNNGNLIAKKNYLGGELVSLWDIDEPSKGDILHDEPDTPAKFAGGAVEWQRYLIRNLRYPLYAQQNKIVGNVQIYFLVDEEGRVRDNIVFKSVDVTIDNEARRLVIESPKWIPATKNGKNVKSFLQQGVQFRLEGTYK